MISLVKHIAWIAILFLISHAILFAGEPHLKNKPVLIVGAGISGLSAAKTLMNHHQSVLVLEARNRIGGRIDTAYQDGVALDLGAAWIHGIKNNPIWDLVNREHIKTIPVAYDDNALSYKLKSWMIVEDGQPLHRPLIKKLQQLVNSFEEFVDDQALFHQRDSIQDAMKQFIALHPMNPRLQHLFQYIVHNVYVYEYGVDLAELSWQCNLPYQYSRVDGVNVLFPNGFAQILKPISEGIPIQLNEVVKSIRYNESGVSVTTNHRVYDADHVIVTVPLGVLQSGAIQFSPKLPLKKQKAMQQLKMSVYNKIYLIYDKPFWNVDKEWLGHIPRHSEPIWDILNLYPFIHKPVLVMFTGGSFGLKMEKYSDQETITRATNLLRKMYGNKVLKPKSFMITRWNKDPYSLGSYSYLARNADLSAYRVLGEPLMKRVFFAGEATSTTDPATVHGAYLSGVRAAREVLASG